MMWVRGALLADRVLGAKEERLMRLNKQLDSDNMLSAVHLALSNWNNLGDGDDHLLESLLLVHEERESIDDWQNPLNRRKATNAVLTRAIGKLEEQNETGAAVLRKRFIEGHITRQVATRLHASPDQVNRWQRIAIEGLTHILISQERKLRDERYEHLLAALPTSPYTQLFGFQEIRREISEQLLRDGEPYVVAISGIGGIGKTSLADAAVRRLIPTLTFDQVVWLRAGKDPLGEPAVSEEASWEFLLAGLSENLGVGDEGGGNLAERMERLVVPLRERPSLVIIDNLERESHTQYVLAQTRQLVNPSKFLLTTRARPTVAAPAFFRSVEELPFNDAADLLRHHAETIGSQALAAADDADYEAIYEVTGGNPLALKLVTGLAVVLPLSQILRGLASSRPGPIESMYRHIYWEAWRSLSAEGQQLLQAMPLVAENGALPEQMMAMSDMAESALWLAVSELFSRSLLEVRGNICERRYSIHRLTETFLRTEIIDWPEEEEIVR
jgi:hypothetical protein